MRGILNNRARNKAAMRFSLSLLLFSILAAACSATAIESQTTRFSIFEDNVAVQSVINMPGEVTGSIRVPIFPDASSVDVYADGISVPAQKDGDYLVISLASTEKVSLSYITSEPLDRSNFLMSMRAEDSVEKLSIAVVLPEGATLKKPITDMSASIYPMPDKASTDGKSLIFVWEYNNVEAGDEFSIFIMFKRSESRIMLVSALVIIIIALVGYVAYMKASQKGIKKQASIKKAKRAGSKKEPAIRVVDATESNIENKKEPSLIEHLKEDEQQIARVLKQRGGCCEQGTLRVVTNFSKAHLSRLLMELEARKVVYKEKRGKKNIVFLKE